MVYLQRKKTVFMCFISLVKVWKSLFYLSLASVFIYLLRRKRVNLQGEKNTYHISLCSCAMLLELLPEVEKLVFSLKEND